VAAAANAQYGPYRNDPRYGGGYNGGYNGGYYGGRGDIVDRVLADLDRAQRYSYSGRGSRELDQARRDLLRFRDNASRGRFDRGRLDNAIGHLDRVVRSGWVGGREREVLAQDLYALRDFRARGRY
jgi:hypothetical protein